MSPEDHVEVWLIDSDDPADNAHLSWVLDEAARAVTRLRHKGRRVLVHCVAAHHRTPAVALRYMLSRGLGLDAARREVETALGRQIDGLRWKEASRV